MKKLMVLLTAVCAIGISQAAFVNWAIDMGKANGGKQYYVFAGSKASDVLAELAALTSESSTKLDGWALATGSLNTKAGKASGNGLDVGSETSLYMVVLDGALAADATYTAGTQDISGMLYTPPSSAPGQSIADSSTFTQSGTIVAGGGGGGGGDIPEPTSGLLLLVGGAMLALRRKQK